MIRQLFYLLMIMGIVWVFMDEFWGDQRITSWAMRITGEMS